MAITARELVFYVRAEDQASRVVKRVARSFGSLSNIRALEAKGLQQQITNTRALDRAQQAILRNSVALQRAQVTSSKLSRLAVAGKALPGYTMQETASLAAAAKANVAQLQQQEKLLASDLDEVRRKGLAASAAIDQQVSQAKLDRLHSYATGVQNLGRALRLIGVVGVAAFGFAAHAAAQFSTQTALAASQARPIGAPAGAALPIQAKIQDQILKQMQQFPASAQDMANSFYQIFSGTNIQNVKTAAADVKLFNEAAVAGGASLDEMTQAGISIKNVFGIGGATGEFKNMTQALNVFFSAVRYGRMTASQFANTLGYITPIAKDVHLSFKNIAADMAFFTRQTGGNMTRQDAQGLARLIQLLARNDVVSGLAAKSIPVFDKLTGRMRPVVSILKDIHDKLHLTPQETVNFFKTISAAGSGKSGTQGTIQAIRIFSQGIQNAKAYQDVVSHVKKDNDEFINSYNQLSKAPGVRWQVFVNQLKAAILVIGGQAIPAFVKLGEPIARLIKWFNGLSDSTKHWIGTVGVFGSVAAVLGGTLLVIIGSIAKLVLTFKELKLLSVASEAGITTAGFVRFFGILGLVLLILYKYPHAFTVAMNAAGGLKNVLLELSIVIAAIRFRSLLASIALIGTTADASIVPIVGLRGKLLALSGMRLAPILIPIALVSLIPHSKKGAQALKNAGLGWLNNIPFANGLFQQAAELGNKAGMALGTHGDLSKANVVVISQIQALQQKIDALEIPPHAKGWKKKIADYQAMINVLKNGVSVAGKSKNALNQLPFDSGTFSGTKPFPDILKVTGSFDVKAAIANVEKLRAAAAKTPSIENYKKYEDALAALRKHYTGSALTALDDYLSTIESAEKKSDSKRLSAAKKAAADRLKQLKDAQSNVMSMYDSLLSQNQSVMGQLFQGPYSQSGPVQNRLQYGGILSGGDLLKDLQSQNAQFTNFYGTIGKLQKRGAPNELVQQLIQAGPQALPAIKALAGMSDSQWKVYISTFNRGQKLLHDQTVKQLKSQLKDYRKYGQSIALQIISGMRDKRLGLANEIKNIIYQMFGVNTPVVTKATKTKLANASKVAGTKPHTKTKDTYSGSKTNTKPVVGTGTRTTNSARAPVHNTYNYNVTAPTSEHSSVLTQLRHAEFASRTKYKGHN